MERQMARPAPARPAREVPRSAGVIESRASSPFDFVGHMTAIVAFLPVAYEAARAILPPGLDLAAQDVMRGDRHPLVLILGRQSGVRSRLLPFAADYLEFILAVPFVEHRAGREQVAGPFCYPARLYLDHGLPTIAGRLLYAYDKRRAAMRMTAHSYRIAESAGGAPVLEAQYRIVGPAIEPSRMAAGTLFDQPVISRSRGGWRYSVAELGLDRAVLQPVGLRLAIHRLFVPGLPLGDFRLEGVDGDGGSAFRICTYWRLAGPCARRSPPASARPQA
jgi:Acetoacetate decarboxylase (ADC)